MASGYMTGNHADIYRVTAIPQLLYGSKNRTLDRQY